MLTTEQLRARAKFWREKAVDAKWQSVSIAQDMLLNAEAFDELAANREAQQVNGELGKISVGRLPTMNQEEYPGLGDWWVQLRIGSSHDEIVARVYSATPEEAMTRAQALAAQPAPAPAVPDAVDYSDLDATSQDREVIEAIAECKGWNACRAAMVQPVSQGYKLPEGFKLMPLEMTDEIGEAIAMEARCCGGIALDIYEAALAAAPEGGNG
ncbi:TPA: hypothetical protein ACXNHV_002352 [Serratia marcescens]